MGATNAADHQILTIKHSSAASGEKRETRACARSKRSRRGGNEAGWCWTAGRRTACRGRAECLDHTESCSPQRTAVFGPTQGKHPTTESSIGHECGCFHGCNTQDSQKGQIMKSQCIFYVSSTRSKQDYLDNMWTISHLETSGG